MSSAMMMMERGMTMPSPMGMPMGGTMPAAMPGMSGMTMLPRCTIRMEKCAGGMKMYCMCEDEVACGALQNLCKMLEGGMVSCCCTWNGMTMCMCNMCCCNCKCEMTKDGCCFTCTTGDKACCAMVQSCCDCMMACMEAGCMCCVCMGGTPVCCCTCEA